ncbi:hypothetical protein COHA_007076 [Chlorella ohadii]|uniref:Uncharacterized protein n=1 Tax=Chlorella ohadii TaxID=2649997 RepID=A0AAD5DK89_9CHLO|nr:hypothetical protein COHA_007076 [Chlorella ohadii]
MEIVQMHLARAAAVVGATHGGPLPGATTPGFPGAAAEEQPAAMPLARPRGMPLTQRWQWDVNVPVPAEQQAPADDDQLDSAAAQQLLGTEQLPAGATAEAEPRAAPWWWPMGHARRPARGAAGGEEAAEGCHCKHCGCHHHHHGGKHHHHSHSEDGQPAPAQQLPMMMAALHDLAQQHAQQAADAQQAQRGHHGAPRHGNRDQLLPGVATPFEFIAQERAQGFTDRWTELQAAQHPAGSSMNWSLWDASGRLNWGLAAFVALAVACAGVWSAMLAHCALYRSARVNNNAAEVLAAQCYHRMASDEPEGGKGDLKPLLREGPVKGAIAAVHTKL